MEPTTSKFTEALKRAVHPHLRSERCVGVEDERWHIGVGERMARTGAEPDSRRREGGIDESPSGRCMQSGSREARGEKLIVAAWVKGPVKEEHLRLHVLVYREAGEVSKQNKPSASHEHA
ncbi:hypothetical protein L227DRAFT_564587 [Lentinus tigrinus ALCF2SS1-6]|uniref:Uncharacterized protein n=1 Tax=Lentinus tigrinus ALCF2SS1-6 TaxID=1328759 RepID=A0A5C2S6D8_9APHY|nr:hypothetical protein L227DRAFT_564587 [Lentinus tigrinus ALCF2SS1-6]